MVQPHTSRILRREIRAGLVATERHERSFGDPSLEDAAGNRLRRRQCGPSSSPVASRSSSELARRPRSTSSCSKARPRRSPRRPFASMSWIGRVIQRPKRASDSSAPMRSMTTSDIPGALCGVAAVSVHGSRLLWCSETGSPACQCQPRAHLISRWERRLRRHGGAISTLMVPVASLPCRHAVASTAYGRARQAAFFWVLSESGSTGWCVSLCNQRPSGIAPVGRSYGRRCLT
jgi:hypothetical protein